jgi:hypothetical protein
MEFDYLTRIGVEQTTKIEGLVSKTGPGSFNSSEVAATEASRSPASPPVPPTRLDIIRHCLPREAFPKSALKD